jgi:hypothetical protein
MPCSIRPTDLRQLSLGTDIIAVGVVHIVREQVKNAGKPNETVTGVARIDVKRYLRKRDLRGRWIEFPRCLGLDAVESEGARSSAPTNASITLSGFSPQTYSSIVSGSKAPCNRLASSMNLLTIGPRHCDAPREMLPVRNALAKTSWPPC